MGLYFWGGVGCGKIYMVDIFFECLLFCRKLCIYFYCFMQCVYIEFCVLQGEKNLLDMVVEMFFEEVWVLCFDEFFVIDIIDVMILGGLMEKFFVKGVILVVIFNIVFD